MKKRKLCMIFLLCLALMTLVAGCRSKKETNDQGIKKEQQFTILIMMLRN